MLGKRLKRMEDGSSGCVECPARNTILCRLFDPQELAGLNRASLRRRYSAGQAIGGNAVLEGRCGTLVSGVIKLSKALSDGRQQIVALLFPGDLLGRPYCAEFPYTVEAATDVLLCWHGRADFDRLLAVRPEANRALLQSALDSIDAAHDWMLLLGRKTALEKVATLLLTLLQKATACCGDPEPSRERILTLPLTRSEMADFLGLRLETVSRQLKQLEASGAIKRLGARCMLVLAVAGLMRAAGPGAWSECIAPATTASRDQ
jgi:CRP/FNR family transcriptional regulator